MKELLTEKTYNYDAQLSHPVDVKAFFHAPTFTFSYVVADPATKHCAVIDSVLDFDLPSGTLSYESADEIIAFIKEQQYTVEWILETHMHADHLSAAAYIKKALGGKVAIGNHIADIQDMYQEVFKVPAAELEKARTQFDTLWADFETFSLGSIPAFTFSTPGHTPADIVYGIGDALFAGDTLFMPDFGTARCDFPRGSAASMYASAQKIFALPENMRMFMCHDYLPEDGRTEYQYQTTVGEQKQSNIHLHEGVIADTFIKMREKRDATLALPKLMIPSLQVNVRAGAIPETDGVAFLQLPINSVFSHYPKKDK